jgi:hypothetical protein
MAMPSSVGGGTAELIDCGGVPANRFG